VFNNDSHENTEEAMRCLECKKCGGALWWEGHHENCPDYKRSERVYELTKEL